MNADTSQQTAYTTGMLPGNVLRTEHNAGCTGFVTGIRSFAGKLGAGINARCDNGCTVDHKPQILSVNRHSRMTNSV